MSLDHERMPGLPRDSSRLRFVLAADLAQVVDSSGQRKNPECAVGVSKIRSKTEQTVKLIYADIYSQMLAEVLALRRLVTPAVPYPGAIVSISAPRNVVNRWFD